MSGSQLNQFQLASLCQEFQQQLTGARLQAIRQHGPASCSLEFYHAVKTWLYLDFQRPWSLCYLREHLPATETPLAWVMALRKQLLGLRLQSLVQEPAERVLRWQFEGGQQLITELSGRHGNLMLLDDQRQIELLLYQDRSERGLARGKVYQPPAPRFWKGSEDFLKLKSLPTDGSRSGAVAAWVQQQQALSQQQSLLQTGWRLLQQELRQAQNQLQRLEADLQALDQALSFQRWGQLLQGAFGQVKRGQPAIRLIDYFEPEQPEIEIPLDPRLDLVANLQRYFKLSRKRERAAERALELLEPAQARLVSLEQQLACLEPLYQRGLSGKLLAAQELASFQQALPQRSAKQAQALKPQNRQPWREFCSLSGRSILVGRSARDNDRLTFVKARGRDIWLHVRDWPGSHVLVPLDKNAALDAETLLDAATLALYYSAAKEQPEADISYCQRKQLQRIKGGAPGQVQLAQAKVIHLRLEPDRLERLLNSRSE